MGDADKSGAEDAAKRVAEWLAGNQEGCQQDSHEKGGLASALGMLGEEVIEAVNYLENRKNVVRFPTLWRHRPEWCSSAAGAWVSLRDEVVGGSSAR